jgi:hypothetical protein
MFNSLISFRKVRCKSSLKVKVKDKINNRYRIKISKTNIHKVNFLVKLCLHTDFNLN